MSPHTLLLMIAGTIGSIVLGLIGLLVGIGQDIPADSGLEPTLISGNSAPYTSADAADEFRRFD